MLQIRECDTLIALGLYRPSLNCIEFYYFATSQNKSDLENGRISVG